MINEITLTKKDIKALKENNYIIINDLIILNDKENNEIAIFELNNKLKMKININEREN